MSAAAQEALAQASQGVDALEAIEEPWRSRLFPVVRKPQLITETLLMVQEFDAAERVFQKVPVLQSDELVLHYAR